MEMIQGEYSVDRNIIAPGDYQWRKIPNWYLIVSTIHKGIIIDYILVIHMPN